MSSKLSSVEQKSIHDLFGAKDSLFLIPDYQRPYAWEEDECLTLWNDIFTFARTDGGFDLDDEYFLGPIVVFRNVNKQLEVIDGQQRLISLLLILRAFYEEMQTFSEGWSCEVRKNIGRCIWKTNEQGQPSFSDPKIDSQVATDNDKAELFSTLPHRILTNCILLPIEANGQNAALRIFSTLNDRGKPLSDSTSSKYSSIKPSLKRAQKILLSHSGKILRKSAGESSRRTKSLTLSMNCSIGTCITRGPGLA